MTETGSECPTRAEYIKCAELATQVNGLLGQLELELLLPREFDHEFLLDVGGWYWGLHHRRMAELCYRRSVEVHPTAAGYLTLAIALDEIAASTRGGSEEGVQAQEYPEEAVTAVRSFYGLATAAEREAAEARLRDSGKGKLIEAARPQGELTAGVYVVQSTGEGYIISGAKGPAMTPGGNLYSTVHEQLARLLCADLNRYGLNPMTWPSFVALHASYVDIVRLVPRSELVRNTLAGYSPKWDFALKALAAAGKGRRGPSTPLPPSSGGVDPRSWFGEPAPRTDVSGWLRQLSRRALAAMQVCGGTFRSILVGYRLLAPGVALPAAQLACGIVHYDASVGFLPASLFKEGDAAATALLVTACLEKVAQYASFTDE